MRNPMMTLPVRSGLQPVKDSDISPSDAPSLLFFYLFDDWVTSYSLVAKGQHTYAERIDKLVG